MYVCMYVSGAMWGHVGADADTWPPGGAGPGPEDLKGNVPMCQYDSRCRVGRHRPGTVCPYDSRRAYGWSMSVPPAPLGAVSAPSGDAGRGVAGRSGDRAPLVGAGGSAMDFVAWMLVLHWWDGRVTLWGIVVGILLLAAPFLIGGELLSRCRAWINDGSRRCEQPRKGFLRRCSDHRSQALTLYDVAGGLSILVGVANILALMAVVLGS